MAFINTELIIIGLGLALVASLATSLGAMILLIFGQSGPRTIASSMGFSAGIMIGLSIFKLLPEAFDHLGVLLSGISLLLGMTSVAFLDFLIPHKYMLESSIENKKNSLTIIEDNDQLLRVGKLVALGIAIHNFPEGLVTISGTIHSLELGIILAIAVFLHNIPEGIAVAIPIYSASNSKKNAFKISFISGLAEPIGAMVGLLFLLTLGSINPEIITLSLAFVAGIMLFISIDEILPYAYETKIPSKNEPRRGAQSHLVSGGILLGIATVLVMLAILS